MEITLRAARMNIGLTRKEASKFFNIHHITLANYENDSSNIPRSFFVNIERVYGINTEHIYFGKEEDHYSKVRNGLKMKQHA